MRRLPFCIIAFQAMALRESHAIKSRASREHTSCVIILRMMTFAIVQQSGGPCKDRSQYGIIYQILRRKVEKGTPKMRVGLPLQAVEDASRPGPEASLRWAALAGSGR